MTLFCNDLEAQSEKIEKKEIYIHFGIWNYELNGWEKGKSFDLMADFTFASIYCALNIFIGLTDAPDLFPLLLKQQRSIAYAFI